MHSSKNSSTPLPDTYLSTLEALKSAVRAAQSRARRIINTELIALYWQIGRTILERQEAEGWGAKVIDRLAADLRSAFPEMKGFSRSNFHYMRKLGAEHPLGTFVPQAVGQIAGPSERAAREAQEVVQHAAGQFVPQAVAQIPWGHIRTLLDKLDDPALREWYATKSVENGWSRAVLAFQISTEAHKRAGAAPSNFVDCLPAPDSELAQEMVKDPYVFEFLTVTEPLVEREVEDQLVIHLQATLLELGRGFSFVGRQVNFNVGGDDFFIDLLFFNYLQNRFVIVELKTRGFKPQDTGQLNMYVQWVDQHLRQPGHAETVGLLLCADRNDEVVRLSLSGTSTPMAVADWKALPADEHAAVPEVDAVIDAVEESGPFQLSLNDFFATR